MELMRFGSLTGNFKFVHQPIKALKALFYIFVGKRNRQRRNHWALNRLRTITK